jgi:hypothetical protein
MERAAGRRTGRVAVLRDDASKVQKPHDNGGRRDEHHGVDAHED